jgi:hypothetical protein
MNFAFASDYSKEKKNFCKEGLEVNIGEKVYPSYLCVTKYKGLSDLDEKTSRKERQVSCVSLTKDKRAASLGYGALTQFTDKKTEKLTYSYGVSESEFFKSDKGNELTLSKGKLTLVEKRRKYKLFPLPKVTTINFDLNREKLVATLATQDVDDEKSIEIEFDCHKITKEESAQ